MDEKRIFTTFDSISVWGLMLGVCVLVGSIVSNAMVDQRHQRAWAQAETLGQQILSGGFKTLTNSLTSPGRNERSPASTQDSAELPLTSGTIGQDPWGQAYSFQMAQDGRGRQIVILVSSGPNKKLDTDQQTLVRIAQGAASAAAAHSDDIVKVMRK